MMTAGIPLPEELVHTAANPCVLATYAIEAMLREQLRRRACVTGARS